MIVDLIYDLYGPDGRSMGSDQASAPAKRNGCISEAWKAMARSEGCDERGAVGFEDGSPLGRSAASIPAVPDMPSTVSDLVRRWATTSDLKQTGPRPSGKREARFARGVYRWLPRGGKKRGPLVGKTRRGKATKIMAVSDRNGLPIAIGIASGERHEVTIVEETLDQAFVEELPPKLIGDKAYDSNELDERLMQEHNIEMIAPHRSTTKKKTQDGRALRRYKRRWHVERLFAWLQNFRRLNTRYERKATNFLGFLQLGCMIVLLRHL